MSLLALQDLFRRYREKATGVWRLGHEPGRTIYFDNGDAVFAQSTHLQDRLTYILVERGKVTQAQMDYALANLKPGLSIGKNLIEMGFITQRDLLEVAKAQVERIICGALATSDQAPVFEPKELDANVVRLPLGTAQVFLAGVLALQNREGLLEMLGPLNQVVVLQGRGLMELTLPQDLAKLPSLLDGTHTLLELSRESLAEPVRLGAFALFLREMGWARLHEMPPLDRQALDLALTPEPEPLSPLLAPAAEEPFPVTVPSLFTTIEEAARPTANLDHLSQSLDADPIRPASFLEDLDNLPDVGDPLFLSEAPGAEEPDESWDEPETTPTHELAQEGTTGVATGQAQMPTPALPIPPLPGDDEDEPRVLLHLPLEEDDADPEPQPAVDPSPGSGLARKVLLVMLSLVLLGACLFKFRHRLWRPQPSLKAIPMVGAPLAVPAAGKSAVPEAPKPIPAQPVPALPAPSEAAPTAAPGTPDGAQAKPERDLKPVAQPERELKPAVQPEPPNPVLKAVRTTISDRLAALNKGDLALAVRQGEARVKELPPSHWTLRLEIACQGETLKGVTQGFRRDRPDLFVLPIKWHDGRSCYQVLYGQFPSREAAERGMKRLPSTFLTNGNRPKPFKISDIPKLQ
jgi:hypothetical protein